MLRHPLGLDPPQGEVVVVLGPDAVPEERLDFLDGGHPGGVEFFCLGRADCVLCPGFFFFFFVCV